MEEDLFAIYNVTYAVSSSVGALISGPIYNNSSSGWSGVCWWVTSISKQRHND